MIGLFRRRDTRAMALGLGALCGLLVLAVGLGTSSWNGAVQIPAGLAVGLAVAALIPWLRRGLPSDIRLVWLTADEQDWLTRCGPLPDRTLLFLALRRDWGRRYRMDIFIDGLPVGQLRPGTGLLLPLRPGLRQMSASLGSRRHAVTETINSLPGLYAGFTIRVWGGRSPTLEIRRLSGDRPTLSRADVRLVHPAVSEA